MAEDVTETNNIAEKHPKVVEELIALHNKWTEEVRKQ
jgi:hypothetical protein